MQIAVLRVFQLDRIEILNLTGNMLPQERAVVTANHFLGNNWRLTARVSYWGAWEVQDSGVPSPDDYGSEVLVDFEASYRMDSGLTVLAGAQNIFDATPEEHPRGASDSGQRYHEHSPFGFNGAYWYTRVSFEF